MSSEDDKSYLTSIAIAFAIALPCIGVSLRLLARTHYRIPLGWDDHSIVIGALFTIGLAIDAIIINKNGNGKHVDTLTSEQILNYFKAVYAAEQLFGVAITAIKISILLFYRRVFSLPRLRTWIHGIAGVVIAWLFANNLSSAFQCSPVRKAWEVDLPGHCYNARIYTKTIQSLNVILDAIILALPLSIVMRLQLSKTRRSGLIVIFLLGGLSIIIAIARIPIQEYPDNSDFTYQTSKTSWTIMEPAVEVFSACLPTMAPLLHTRVHLHPFYKALRAMISSRSTRPRHMSPIPSQYDGEPNLRPHSHNGVISTVSVESSLDRNAQVDDIPLRAIKVRHDIESEEKQIRLPPAVHQNPYRTP